ncbi:hypothetical protein GHR37_07500 [Achromobacter xylosoxidans]|jgi:hypothetical protein|uniref:hypothetical protein n=1 Tax=Achromobacter sp. HZ01 TaxID=1416886 RepID=UPI0011BF0B9C|nr:hypothetical protein [Achromobacter sp. HZ01]MBO9328974.1 hypothetical protein [Achromobacter xylosoxidans]
MPALLQRRKPGNTTNCQRIELQFAEIYRCVALAVNNGASVREDAAAQGGMWLLDVESGGAQAGIHIETQPAAAIRHGERRMARTGAARGSRPRAPDLFCTYS